jgi:hypothetical protein
LRTHVFVRPIGLLLLLAALALSGASASTASAAVPGLQTVKRSSAFNSNSPKSVTAPCPLGKRVIGTGAEINGARGQAVIDDLTPTPDLRAVTVTAYEDDDGTSANWSVSAYAICANPPPGLQLVPSSSPSNSSDKTLTASCPLGKRLTGIGGDVTNGRGQVVMDLVPNPELRTVTVRGFEDQNGTTAGWSLRAYAICANPLAGLQRVVRQSPQDSANPKSITAPCPTGKRLIGTGADIANSDGQVVLDDLSPNAARGSVLVTAYEDDNGTTARWSMRALAICANP